MKYSSTLKEKYRISARPCNILYIFSVYDDDISLFLRKFNGKRFKIVKVVFSVEIFKSLNLGRQEPMTRVVMGSCGR